MAYEDLANAIIEQAALDYRIALIHNMGYPSETTKAQIAELEKFFRSNWYRVLTNVDGEYLIERIRADVAENPKIPRTKKRVHTYARKLENKKDRKEKKYAD